jgi:hypothetical protein
LSEKEKKDIKATVEILKQLDKQSLLILDSGARMLKARQDMENAETGGVVDESRET